MRSPRPTSQAGWASRGRSCSRPPDVRPRPRQGGSTGSGHRAMRSSCVGSRNSLNSFLSVTTPRYGGHGKHFMPIKEQTGIRPLESLEDFCETRIEAVGFIFHGNLAGCQEQRATLGDHPTCSTSHAARSSRRSATTRPRSGSGVCGSLTSTLTSWSARSAGSGASCASGKSPSACSTSPVSRPGLSAAGQTLRVVMVTAGAAEDELRSDAVYLEGGGVDEQGDRSRGCLGACRNRGSSAIRLRRLGSSSSAAASSSSALGGFPARLQ